MDKYIIEANSLSGLQNNLKQELEITLSNSILKDNKSYISNQTKDCNNSNIDN